MAPTRATTRWLVLALAAVANAQRPFDEVAAAVRAGTAELADADAPTRAAAAQHIVLLLEKLQTNVREPFDRRDDRRREASWREAQELRVEVATALCAPALDAIRAETLPVALWLWEHGECGRERAPAARALAAAHTPDVDRLFLSIAERGCTVPVACRLALERVAERNLRIDPDVLRRWCDHFHADVRAAARTLAAARGIEVPAFDPARSLGPDLEQLLAFLTTLTPVPIPADAQWGSLTDQGFVRPEPDRDGWLLAGGERDPVRVITILGERLTWAPGAKVPFVPSPLQETARRLIQGRSVGRAGRGSNPEVHTRRLRLFEPLAWQPNDDWILGPAEWFVAAWSFSRGDRATAGELLLPRLQQAADLRDALRPMLCVAADELAWTMASAFADERDYDKALALARVLQQPAFAGSPWQDQANELSTQLVRRRDDFAALQLPTAAEWARLQTTMTRAQQIDYLVARLRLVHCRNGSRFFIDRLAATQLGEGAPEWADYPASDDVRIHPCETLLRLDLTGGELRTLLATLRSREFALGWQGADLWRDGFWEWPPGAIRVAVVAAAIGNECAARTIADPLRVQCEGAVPADIEREWLAFCREHEDERTSDRLAARLSGSDVWDDTLRAFWNLHELDPPRAAAALRDATATRYPARVDAVARELARLERGDRGQYELLGLPGWHWAQDP